MKILIVGGVAGGASAAARARRLSEEAEIVMFERGEYISFANCGMPYHIGGVIKDRKRLLVQTPEAMRQRFNIDVRTRTEVLKIDRTNRSVLTKDLGTGIERKEQYDFLILSPGAEPLRPPLPGIESRKIMTLRNLADMDAIKAVLDSGSVKKAVVVGGGYIGLEMAEALREQKVHVTLVELREQVMEPVDPEMAALLHQELGNEGVDLRLGTAVKGFSEANGNLTVNLTTGEMLNCDLAVLSIGVRPESRLAKDAGLAIGDRGGIITDENMRTNDPNIYAVGDAVEVPDFVTGANTVIPLAGPANRQGRIAADSIFGKQAAYKMTQGTAICKLFGLAAGMTGLNEKQLKGKGIRYEKVYVHPAAHASYYPGAAPISIKLLFDPENGKILGAQAVGRNGVDKRIDVLSVAMRAGLTVKDLADMELCYAPPYGSAKDPINYLGFVASNILDGTCGVCHADEIANPSEGQRVLDVRTEEEVRAGKVPGAVHIPVDELRKRMDELPKDKEILAYCKVGLRGYLACRILKQNGFKCRNLTGGYLTFEAQRGLIQKQNDRSKELTDDSGSQNESKTDAQLPAAKKIDACGLQCPGPIMQLKMALDASAAGEVISIAATDPGFPPDVKAWCESTGNELVDINTRSGRCEAVIRKREKNNTAKCKSVDEKAKTIIVFSNDLDKVIASFIIANGAAAMGSKVTLFFTFWGLNALRKQRPVSVRKNLIEHMFGWMMPRGAGKLVLSKMHMAGAGTWMIKDIMKRKNVQSLPELIQAAVRSGVRLVACTMSMDLMGIKKEELIDGVEMGGVAMYLQQAEQGNVNLFI
jgi:NADPH-dependent 2,4-dienoyl-CoA reductase/sulfur reductase-like enzyme/peroxiredoxin family protein/rhodanese-related sulfurtransferase/TusA-related sulfurtransferase